MNDSTHVDELMRGRKKPSTTFLGVQTGKWVMWSIGVFGAVIVGYFGVIQRVEINTGRVHRLELELVEVRKQARALEIRINGKDVQDALVAKHLDEDRAIRELLQAIEDCLEPSRRRR